jgi:hypothetical protein
MRGKINTIPKFFGTYAQKMQMSKKLRPKKGIQPFLRVWQKTQMPKNQRTDCLFREKKLFL